MSAAGIAEVVVKAVEDGTFDVLIVNFANADMVGHSGQIEPTIKAVETVDACLGRIELAIRAKVCHADHCRPRQAEMMIDPATAVRTRRTPQIPYIYCCRRKFEAVHAPKTGGSLRDISPTFSECWAYRTQRDEGTDLRVKEGS